MKDLYADLNNGRVRADGVLLDRFGSPTGLRVLPGGYLLTDDRGHAVATLTMVGRIYDGAGELRGQVTRYDMHTTSASDDGLNLLERAA